MQIQQLKQQLDRLRAQADEYDDLRNQANTRTGEVGALKAQQQQRLADLQAEYEAQRVGFTINATSLQAALQQAQIDSVAKDEQISGLSGTNTTLGVLLIVVLVIMFVACAAAVVYRRRYKQTQSSMEMGTAPNVVVGRPIAGSVPGAHPGTALQPSEKPPVGDEKPVANPGAAAPIAPGSMQVIV